MVEESEIMSRIGLPPTSEAGTTRKRNRRGSDLGDEATADTTLSPGVRSCEGDILGRADFR